MHDNLVNSTCQLIYINMKEESTLAGIHFSSASDCDLRRLRSNKHSRSLSAPLSTYSTTPSLSTIPNLPPQSTYPRTFTNEAHVHKRNLRRRYTQTRASSLDKPKNLTFFASIDLAHNSVQPKTQPKLQAQLPSSSPTFPIDTFPGSNPIQKKPPCKDAPSSRPHPQTVTSTVATTISRAHSDTRSNFLAAKNNYINSCNSAAPVLAATAGASAPPSIASLSPRSVARSTFSAPPGEIVPRRHFVYPDPAVLSTTPEQALALANLELMAGSRPASLATPSTASVSVVQTTTATGAPKPTTRAIASLVLPSALVPYIWPTSAASFCTGVVVGLGLALLRPVIEHYVDISAGYVALGMRYVLIWGSVGLIAWVVLRVLQQTSKATLILNPAENVPTETAGPNSMQAPARSEQDSYYDHARYARHNSTATTTTTTAAGGLESSASSIYSSADSLTSASSSSTSASSLYYSPPTPQYNPYSRSTSPVRAGPQQPCRKPVSGSPRSINSANSSASLRSGSPTRRIMEPRIVALDEPADGNGSFRPYTATPARGGYRKTAGDTVGVVLEKGVGQNAFRIQRG